MILARKTPVPTSVMKQRTVSGMRTLAGKIDADLPGMATPHHLRDAANALEQGNHEGAKRHLQSAMHTMTPNSMMRHGVLDDDGHSRAKVNMDLINRHYLLVRDLEDAHAHNEALRATPAAFTQPSHLPMGRSMDPMALPGSAQTGGPGQPKSVQGAMIAAPKQNTGTDKAVAAGPKAPDRPYNQLPGRPMPQAVLSWEDADRLIEMSAQTPRLASTPAPYGKPGGPGLYGVKGNKHSDYFEQIVKALMEKRGMDKGKASAVAWGALRRWSAGKGHVHPEVQGASADALGKESAARARAHAHANGDEQAWQALDMAINLSAFAAGGSSGPPPPAQSSSGGGGSASVQPRVPAGSSQGGQFGSASSGSSNKNKPAASSNSSNAQRKTQMLKQAAQDRAQAALLIKQLASLTAASKATTAKTLAATKAGATGKSASPTPAKKTAAPAVPAAAKTTAKATAAKPGAKPTRAQLVTNLKTQIAALLTQANTLTAQAAKL